MNAQQFRKAQTKAKQLCNKIDKFIADNDRDLILSRLIKSADEYDKDSMLFEIGLQWNVKTVKITSLTQEYKFEAFLEDIAENPYQLKLIA